VGLKGAAGVAVELAGSCTELRKGPNLVKNESSSTSSIAGFNFSQSSSSIDLEERRVDCSGSPEYRELRKIVLEEAKTVLEREGHPLVAPAEATASVRLAVDLKRTRTARIEAEPLRDTGPNGYCKKVCGRPTCVSVDLRAEQDVAITADVARPGAAPQNVTQTASILSKNDDLEVAVATRMGQRAWVVPTPIAVCYNADAADASAKEQRWAWPASQVPVTSAARVMTIPLFARLPEEVEVRLFKIDGSAETSTAIAAGEKGEWAAAIPQFKAALDKLSAAAGPANAKNALLGRYNLATAHMQAGNLVEARALVDAAKDDPDSIGRDLRAELDRRIADSARM
jgi:hypothetical protein